ncbi:MAG: TolC family protein [candidate division Zixibacteria bacterium]|nr:TolC family protein [candidate division Zixibacteria bacterium]
MKGILMATALTVVLFAVPTTAQEVLTLKDFLAKVEKNNPEIRAGQKLVESREAMRKAAGAWEDPMLDVDLSRMPADYPAPGSSGIIVQDKLLGRVFGISQKLPFFGTLNLKKKIAGQEKYEAEFGFKQTRLEKRSEAKKAYWEWARLQKDKALLERAFLIWGKLVSVTHTAYSKAEGEHHAYLRAQVELVKLEAENLEISEALKKTAAWLAYLAGEKVPVDSLRPEPMAEEPERSLPADSILKLAVENNPEIKMLVAMEGKARFEKNLAAKQYYPDFVLSAYYNKGMIDPFHLDRLMNVYGGKLSLRLPLFSWTTRSKEVQGKSLEIERASFLRKNVENEIRAEVEMLLAEIDRLDKQVRIYKEALLPRAQLLVEEGQTAYTVGRLSFPDFSEAQLEQIELERKYYGLLADYWKTQAELDKTIGID